jgi:soluble lytic murein transglycosylase
VAARLAEDADAGPAALEAAEALDRLVPDDFLLDLAPRSVLRSLAPRPFDRLVAEAADQSGVPRDLLYAIMRQESRFDREAASPAAARGLMQLTLPTAGEAARELNETPPAYAELYDPARSLRLGARTLKNLLARFDGDAALAASGYNAGAGQTALWAGGAKAPTEALLASITYPETRTYLRRVLANRILYRKAEPDQRR